MKIIQNNLIPFKGFQAITIWPFIFTHSPLTVYGLNHENIHGKQQKELLLIGFYLTYLFEWIIKGYDNSMFEKEAYNNEGNLNYLKTRKPHSFLKYT